MAIYDNERLVIKVCQLFYNENKSQKEIATLLNISKPQICRILSYAKENHIVEFTIHNPYAQEFELENQLVKKYGLKEAFIFDIKPSDKLSEQLGEAFAPQLDRYLTDNTIIGVMSGRSVFSIANYAHRLNRENLLFVPLAGGQGASGDDWQANAIARTFAKKTGGSYRLLNAPILVKNSEIRDLFCKEPSIEETLAKAKSCAISLVGIGNISSSSSAYLDGYFEDKDIPKLLQNGAVASVGTSFLNLEGQIVSTQITDRSIGISLPEMQDSLTIAIATGNDKLEAVYAALKSGFIDVLVSTLQFSELLLQGF